MTNEIPPEHADPAVPKQGGEPTNHLTLHAPPSPDQPPSSGRSDDGAANWALTGDPSGGVIEVAIRGRLTGIYGFFAGGDALQVLMDQENRDVPRILDLRGLEAMDALCVESVTKGIGFWLGRGYKIAVLLPHEGDVAQALEGALRSQHEVNVFWSVWFASTVLAFPKDASHRANATSARDESR